MIYKLQNGRTIPLGGDYLEYLQSIPEIYGGSIQPSIKVEPLPKKFKGSQKAARTYAEGYQKGAKPVTKAIDNAGQKIFNTTKNVAMFVPGPTGAITWLGQMGADTANGEYSKVAKDLGAVVLVGAGLKGAQIGAKAAGRALAGKGVNIPWLDAYDYSALRNEYFNKTTMKGSSNVPITIENIPDSHQMFRASVYKGGNIKDPYFSFFTTDPEYARQYGPVNKYILEQKGPVAIAKEPMIGSRDVATNDMFIDRNTRDVPGAKIILGHDLVTPDIPVKSKGLEILSFNKPSLLKPIVSPQEAAATYHFNGRIPSSKPISMAEKLGIPKGERSNPKALEDPYYWGYQQWNDRYNAAISAGNVPEIQRLRALHFITKAPNTKVIETTGMPKEVYHGSVGEKFTVFDSSKTRPDYDYGTSTNMFSDNRNVALGYANNDPDKLHSVYLNLRNILERDFKGNPWNGSVNNSGKFQIVPEYGTTYSSKQEAETALQKMLDQYYPNNPAKQAEQRHYMYVIELMDPPHPERSTNAFSDEIVNIPTLDGGIVRNVKDYYDLPLFDKNPELYKELTTPHTDYFVKDPRNIKSSAIITYDDFGRIIPIVKRDNFHNPDIRYKQGGKI